MRSLFYRIVLLIDGLALLMDGLALIDFLLHPLAQDHTFDSALYRAVTVLGLVPLTLLVGFLIIRRVPGNVVGPLLIMWSGTVAYNSVRAGVSPVLFSLCYAYDLVFGWVGLFQMFLHFPDGKIQPRGAARWIYAMLAGTFLVNPLIFLTTDPLLEPFLISNPFPVAGLMPYAGLLLAASLVLITPSIVLSPVSFVLRYRKGSLLERQQIKWLALFGGLLVMYTLLVVMIYPLLTGGPVMTPGEGPAAMIFYLSAGLFPALVIGISVLRYRLWDIDRIIRRTLIYSSLTLILSLIYLGSVLALRAAFAFLFDLGSSDLAVVFSTLAIAVLFVPLRARIQRSIDRRYYRQKYNTEQTLARFAATARTEVMLEPLIGALLTNVEETMHPEGVSLWLMKGLKQNEDNDYHTP